MTATPQHAVARRKAAKVYGAQRDFRAEVGALPRAEGFAVLAEVLERPIPPLELGTLRLIKFLSSARGVQGQRAEELLEEASLPMHRWDVRIRDLTLPERSKLCGLLLSRCKPVEYATEPHVWPPVEEVAA